MTKRVLAFLLTLIALPLAADFREFQKLPVDPALEAAVQKAAAETLAEFKADKFGPNDLAITLIDLTNPGAPHRASYNGSAPFYPASVIKVPFMLAVYHQVDAGQLKLDAELQRALGEMIRVSDNDATAYILDILAGTTGGPSLEGWRLDRFIRKREVVNRWLGPMGYDVSAMAKPWSFGPFGRDKQVIGANRERRNRATGDAFASMMLWIVRHQAVSHEASDAMLALLARPLPAGKDENQVKEFLGESLPEGSKLWSKAGWTSEVRHDAAYIELPNGRRFVAVVMTRGIADNVTLIPAVGKKIVAMFAPARTP
jgi:beta-lactamase class A